MQSTTYNQLNIFHTIVQERSINAAARKLGIAAPSVSQALKTLEINLGQTLFYRSTRRLELTEPGQLLFDRTFSLSSELSAALESVEEFSKSPSGKISLTLPRFVMQYYLKPVYADFCRLYPDVELEISVNDATVDIVKEGIDFCIRFGDKVEQGMVGKALISGWNDALFASPEYIEQYGLPETIEDLQDHKLIEYRFISSNKIAPLLVDKNGESVRVKMKPGLIVNDTDLMIDAAKQGLGIGRIVDPVVAEEFSKGTLIPILKPHWHKVHDMYLGFPQTSQRLIRNRLFIDFLVDRFAD